MKLHKIIIYILALIVSVLFIKQIVTPLEFLLFQNKEIKIKKSNKEEYLYKLDLNFTDIEIFIREYPAGHYIIFSHTSSLEGFNYYKDQYDYDSNFNPVKGNIYKLSDTYDYGAEIVGLKIRRKVEFTLLLNKADIEKSVVIYHLKPKYNFPFKLNIM